MNKINKIRILYVGPVPPEVGGQNAGGVATQNWQLANKSFENGYQVFILANNAFIPTKDTLEIFAQQKNGNKLKKIFTAVKIWPFINRKELKCLEFLDFRKKVNLLYRAHHLRTILNIVKPSILHIQSFHNTYNLCLKLLKNQIPLVISDRGFWQVIQNENDIKKVKGAANRANYIICNSNYTKEQLEKYKIAPDIKTKVIHNPVDIKKISFLNKEKSKKELGLETSDKTILFSGMWEPVKTKGLDILLNTVALDQRLKEECKIIIITNEEGKNFAQEFVKKSQIDILILGPQSREKLNLFYNAADIFVMPSRSESFGNVYTEALMAGTPVIGFHRIMDELSCILNTYIGEKFNVDKESEKDLAYKIKKIFKTHINRKLVRKKVIENFSLDCKFNEFDYVYKELLIGHSE